MIAAIGGAPLLFVEGVTKSKLGTASAPSMRERRAALVYWLPRSAWMRRSGAGRCIIRACSSAWSTKGVAFPTWPKPSSKSAITVRTTTPTAATRLWAS